MQSKRQLKLPNWKYREIASFERASRTTPENKKRIQLHSHISLPTHWQVSVLSKLITSKEVAQFHSLKPQFLASHSAASTAELKSLIAFNCLMVLESALHFKWLSFCTLQFLNCIFDTRRLVDQAACRQSAATRTVTDSPQLDCAL